MPNWVMNRVLVRGDKKDVLEFKKKHFVKNEFDFNTVIPMPEHIFKGNLGQQELKQYGQNNWYNWSIKNWGTKWNACCDSELDFNIHHSNDKKAMFEFSFKTAWSMPTPIYEKIASLYPNFKITAEFADEDIGTNCGVVKIVDGEIEVEYLEDEMFASKVWNL